MKSLMKKVLKIKRGNPAASRTVPGLQLCHSEPVQIESGEIVPRGCGHRGLTRCETGWHCLYCGRYIYDASAPVDALWFHYRTAREYWRCSTVGGRDYINGMPVLSVTPELEKGRFQDLEETAPPNWFAQSLETVGLQIGSPASSAKDPRS